MEKITISLGSLLNFFKFLTFTRVTVCIDTLPSIAETYSAVWTARLLPTGHSAVNGWMFGVIQGQTSSWAHFHFSWARTWR